MSKRHCHPPTTHRWSSRVSLPNRYSDWIQMLFKCFQVQKSHWKSHWEVTVQANANSVGLDGAWHLKLQPEACSLWATLWKARIGCPLISPQSLGGPFPCFCISMCWLYKIREEESQLGDIVTVPKLDHGKLRQQQRNRKLECERHLRWPMMRKARE